MTQEEALRLFEYKDGMLYWKTRGNGFAPFKIGSKVGSVCERGYARTKINGKGYLVHRLIYLMHNGFIPEFIDHIDGNKNNNKIENLRPATRAENYWNVPARKTNNLSKIKNVHWNKSSEKWAVVIKRNKKTHYCGLFKDLELAELVAIEARNHYHGAFALQ